MIMTKHATLSPSKAIQWVNCPGSIKATKDIPKEMSEFALEGIFAHKLAEKCLKKDCNAEYYRNKMIRLTKDNSKKSLIIDDDMIFYVQKYLDYIRGLITDKTEVFFEQKVTMNKKLKIFGTADAVIADYENKICHVIDLKYGRGIEISAVENWQCMIYALGVLNEIDWISDFKTIVLHIVQPRIYNYSKWIIGLETLQEAEIKFIKSGKLAMTLDAPRIPGIGQCQWCLVRDNCKPLFNHIMEIIMPNSKSTDIKVPNVDDLTESEISNVINAEALVLNFISSVKGRALNDIQTGKKISGVKVVRSRANKRLTSDAPDTIQKEIGNKGFSERKPLPISKLTALLPAAIMDEITTKPEGNLIVVSENDKREAISFEIDQSFVDETKSITNTADTR